MKNYLREMSFGEIIDGSLRLYIANFGVLFLIYLLPVLAADLITDLTFRFLAAQGDVSAEVESSRAMQETIGNIATLVVTIIASAAITVGVSDVCLGQRPKVLRAYRRVFQLIGKFLWTYLLFMLVTLIGLMLLVIPGIWATVVLMFAITVVILERRGGMDALKRSASLSKGYRWRNLGVLTVTFIVAIMGQLILLLIASFAVYYFDKIDEPGVIAKLIISIATSILGPVPLIACVLLYYDIRVRKENYDLATLTQELLG